MYFSFVIPVYNRPDEIDELLDSLVHQQSTFSFEVVVVEDGSTISCREVVEKYFDKLSIKYLFKPNSGPGDSRNYGMQRAKGDYFIILDSDCILPADYLQQVDKALKLNFVDCFGGPDGAHENFSDLQKAINFAMTNILTTGGIRGASEKTGKFQPRSFNMGLSKKAFEISGGYGKIHPGEDPDLSIRLWKLNFKTALFTKALVFHKRRIDWIKFYTQVYKFGKARPILNQKFPEYSKLTYWFPLFFCLGFVLSLISVFFSFYLPLAIYIIYFSILFVLAFVELKSIRMSFFALWAVMVQFSAYAIGFLEATVKLKISNSSAEEVLPEMFFK